MKSQNKISHEKCKDSVEDITETSISEWISSDNECDLTHQEIINIAIEGDDKPSDEMIQIQHKKNTLHQRKDLRHQR